MKRKYSILQIKLQIQQILNIFYLDTSSLNAVSIYFV